MLDIRVCSRALIKYQDKYLWTKFEIKNNIFPLLVGGKVEIDETPVQAIVREIKEEVQLDAIRLGFVSNYNVECDNKQACDYIAGWLFLVEVNSDKLVPEDEILLYDWVDYATMRRDFPFLPTVEPTFTNLTEVFEVNDNKYCIPDEPKAPSHEDGTAMCPFFND